MDYTAVGQTTHLAARMEQMAMPGSILITAGDAALGEGYVQVKPLGPVPVKGLRRRWRCMRCWARAGADAAAGRGGAGPDPLCGRDTETGPASRQALERAGAGHGQVVALVGEPGWASPAWSMSSSSSASHPGLAGPGEHARCPMARPPPYLPVIDLLKPTASIETRDDARTHARARSPASC